MKKSIRYGIVCTIAVLMVVTMAAALTACGQSGSEPESEPEQQTEQEAEQEEQGVGMANPWTDVATAEEAAEGAGVGTFKCAGIETSLGVTDPVNGYRWMVGIAEAQFPIAAVDMCIRKGTEEAALKEEETGMGDISGDYNDYKYTWTQNVGKVTVQCRGNRKGESTNTTWKRGDYYYSITAFGAGGDDDFGLSKKDVKALVKGVR